MLNKLHARKWVMVAVIFQVSVLAFMAGKREWIIATGETIFLRSAPIDPRDPFRGDFVRLRYGINSLHTSHYQGEAPIKTLKNGQVLYTVLKPEADDVYGFDFFTDNPPQGKPYLKGRVTKSWQFMRNRENFINLKYGIEQYFVEQGKGKTMEARLGTRESLQVPAEMRLAVGGDGTAVITGHRWSKIGIQLEFIREAPSRRNENDPIISPIIKITLENVSRDPLSLATLGKDCAFSLSIQSNNFYNKTADASCPAEQAIANSVVLQPSERYAMEFDLSQPRWHIEHDGQRVEVGTLTGWQQYRMRYSAPALEGAWQGSIETPLFSVNGQID